MSHFADAYDNFVEETILPRMELRCAWHPRYFGVELVMRAAQPGYEGHDASHGICPECRAKLERGERMNAA